MTDADESDRSTLITSAGMSCVVHPCRRRAHLSKADRVDIRVTIVSLHVIVEKQQMRVRLKEESDQTSTKSKFEQGRVFMQRRPATERERTREKERTRERAILLTSTSQKVNHTRDIGDPKCIVYVYNCRRNVADFHR